MFSKISVRVASAIAIVFAVAVSFQNCSPQFLNGKAAGLLDQKNSSRSKSLDFLKGASLNSNLRYFGFFADGMEHEGSGNYISETAEVANIHFISADSVEGLTEKIKLAASRNSQVVILVEGFLFDWQTLQLQKNYKTNLANLKNHLVQNNLLGSVLGFYVVDEPYFKNSVAQAKLSDQNVFNNLKAAATEINSVFGSPQILITSEAVPTLDKYMASGQWLGFPSEISWVAVNCYLAFGSMCDTPAKYESYVSALHSTLQSNQHLFLTLDNYTNKNSDVIMENKLVERTKFQIQLAVRYDAVALVSFIYQSAPDRSGLTELPALRSFVFDLASSITGKGSNLAKVPPPELPPVRANVPQPIAVPNLPAPLPNQPAPGPHFVRGPGDDGMGSAKIPFAVLASNSSNSFSGDNSVCNTGMLYLKFTGTFQETQKGCVAPAGSGACNLVDANAFRKFSPGEYLNSTTVLTVSPASNYPVGNYEVFTQAFFTLPAGGIEKVGSFTIKRCDATAEPQPQASPPPVGATCTNLEPKCEGGDSVRRNTCGDVVEAWRNAPICTHVRCEGADYVRRDSDNHIVEVWKNAPLCENLRD